jgi:hypothetical protein
VSASSTLTRPADPSPSRPAGAEGALTGPAGGQAASHAGLVGVDGLFTALFALAGWIVGSGRMADNSFFWHLRTGEYILDHGIPHHDVFSYTAPGTRWVAQSWLAEVTYGILDRAVGPFGIQVFVGLVGVAVGVLAYRLALRLCHSPMRAAGITAAALTAVFSLWSERPLVIGLVCLLALIWLVEVPDSWIARHPLVTIPILMWLWANVHGSFALGFAYLALHVLGRWADGAPPWQGRERTLVLASLIAFAATFVNPYGVELVLFPVELLRRGDILSHVVEWQSPDFRSQYGIALAAWLCVFVAAVARGRYRVSRRDLIVTVPMLLLALWALRNIAVAPLVCLPVVARAFAVEGDGERTERYSRGFLTAVATVIVAVGVVIGVQEATEPHFAFGSYPVRSMRYVVSHGLLGQRLFADDADAGYVILRYWPQQRVFIDDRYDMYPTGLIHEFFDVASGAPDWQRVLDRHHVDVVVWKRHRALTAELDQSPKWQRVHTDASDAVWVRR